MHNIQVTFDQSPNNARSESTIAIDPYDPKRIVAASKKFFDPQTYAFTIGISYSHDGGYTWKPCADLDISTYGWAGISDPSLTWDDQGNAYLLALPFTGTLQNFNLVGIAVYKSTDGGLTWSKPTWVYQGGSDKQWISADVRSGTNFQGRLYSAWDGNGLSFTRSLDGGATWIGDGPVANPHPAGGSIAQGSFAPEINVANNGWIYIAYLTYNPPSIQLLVSMDGGDSFQPSATAPATNIHIITADFPKEKFRVGTIPTACAGDGQTVAIAWADTRLGAARIFYALSDDAGTTWKTGPSGKALVTTPVSATMYHFHPQMVITGQGANQVIGCAFYQFGPASNKPAPKSPKPLISVLMTISYDSGVTFENPITVTDHPWDPTIDAPLSHGDANVTFIGDYFGLDVSPWGFYPLWTDTRTQIQELFTDIVRYKNLKLYPNPDALVAEILFGVIQDGGGAERVGGHVLPIPPWDPEGPVRDILYGLASYQLASGVRDLGEAHALQQAAMSSVGRLVERALGQLDGEIRPTTTRSNGEGSIAKL